MTMQSNFRSAAEWRRISAAWRNADAKLLAKGIIKGSKKWYALRDREFRRCLKTNEPALSEAGRNQAPTL